LNEARRGRAVHGVVFSLTGKPENAEQAFFAVFVNRKWWPDATFSPSGEQGIRCDAGTVLAAVIG
jgi:hypothetical protein